MTCSSLCARQRVSSPFFRWFSFRCPELSHRLCSTVGVCTSLAHSLSLAALTRPSVCARQLVSAIDLLSLYRCTDLFLRLHSTESECPRLLAYFLRLHMSFRLRLTGSECPSPAGFLLLS